MFKFLILPPGAGRAVVAWGQQQHGAGEAPRDEKPPPLCCVCVPVAAIVPVYLPSLALMALLSAS